MVKTAIWAMRPKLSLFLGQVIFIVSIKKEKARSDFFIADFLEISEYDAERKSMQSITEQGKLIRLYKGNAKL